MDCAYTLAALVTEARTAVKELRTQRAARVLRAALDRALLKSGAEVDIRNKHGATPLSHAVVRGRSRHVLPARRRGVRGRLERAHARRCAVLTHPVRRRRGD